MVQIAADLKFPNWSGIIQSLQNSLTLKASSSGNIIIGSPNNLNPEVNNTQTLGTSFLRWANLFATSGNFSNRPTVAGDNVALISDINQMRPVDARAVSGHIIPDTDNRWVLGNASRRWSGIDTVLLKVSGLLAQSNSVIRASGHIHPLVNNLYNLGNLSNNWAGIFGSSGVFDSVSVDVLIQKTLANPGIAVASDLGPLLDNTRVIGVDFARFAGINTVLLKVSGLNAQDDHIISVSGHLVPGTSGRYDLGTDSRHWGTLYAVSGIFADDVNVGDTVTAFGFTAVIGAAGLLVSTNFVGLNRPEIGGVFALDTGSGAAVRNEIRWYDHLQNNSALVDVTNLELGADVLSTRSLPVVINERVILEDFFGMSTSHSDLVAPSEWVVLLRRHQSNGTVGSVASGFFSWASTTGSVQITLRKWTTSGNLPVEFEQGAGYDVVVHNNGSGNSVDSPSARLTLGFHINAPNLGRGA